ncbi:unnamed protein product [Echinostoma caproni]|uniref:Galactose-1-phosphate uridylyltransferase n=1 Tax=Echinostoma caproni TaxID=27848 RepID=A0A183AWJ5_9TREM|nr:unnamed protein product [Echinostoma caproni]
MTLNQQQKKVIDHLTQIEEVGELILAKQEQCVSCDRSRQKTREAIRALTKLDGSNKQWACLSNQFFLLPREPLITALREDMKVYDSEIEKTRQQIKEDMQLLNELEEKEPLKGFDLIALSKADIPNIAPFDPAEDVRMKQDSLKKNKLFAWTPAHGQCSVMCFHPRSDLTLALMNQNEVLRVIQAWCKVTNECRTKKKGCRWLQIFENRGAAVGSSNMHPHCQIWECGFLPSLASRYDQNQWAYFKEHQIPLLVDYAHQEEEKLGHSDCRIVLQNEHWLVLVPWWACWPFETMILPRNRHIRWLDELTSTEQDSLTYITRELLIRYDNLFQTEFPYSMGWYQAPMNNVATDLWCSASSYREQAHWQLHALFQPPLLRSATVRKFMSGFELLAEAQRDVLPERAAELLRQTPAVHYTQTVKQS